MSVYTILASLLGISAFFSSAETALFSLDRQLIAAYADSRNPLRRVVARLLSQPRKLLITILLGNLVVNVTFYAVASVKALELMRAGRPLAATVMGIMTPMLVIIVGEVTPKTLALGFATPIASAVAPVLYVLKIVFWPVRFIVEAITSRLSTLVVGRCAVSTYVTPDELKMLITTGESQGLIDREEGVMMRELVDFGTVMVRDVMVPRVDMVMFQKDRPRGKLVELIRREGHSHVPVYGSSADDIVGILDTKEVLTNRKTTIEDLLHRVYFVPETKMVESLLDEFRLQHRSFAVVVDEYGGTAGLVTLEDVVEVIVGEIQDEYESVDEGVRDLGDNRYLLSGRLSIADWAEMFGMSIGERRLATLGGLVIKLLGHLPRPGEQVRHGNVLFTVESVMGNSIETVLVEYAESASSEVAS